MAARSLPDEPTFADRGRYVVWRRLVTQLRPEDVVLSNLRLIGAQQDHDIDFVVVMPDVGIMVVEVQGGAISTKGLDWYRDGEQRVTPIGHVLGNLFAVRRYLNDDARWPGRRLRMQHCLIAPDSDLPAGFEMPDCTRAQIHAAQDQPHLATRMREILMHDHQGGRPPRADEVEMIASILHGPLPDDAMARPAMRLTVDQAEVLRAQRQLPRTMVSGSAGTGKSTLAMAQARELTRGRPDTARQRVALVCYSSGHGARMRRLADTLELREQPAFVGTFEQLGSRWGVSVTDRGDAEAWEHRFPQQVTERLGQLPEAEKFDSIIVDEAHDFTGSWWMPLMAALRDGERGGFHLYRDANVHLFRGFAPPPLTTVSLMLHQNLRNTSRVATAFSALTPGALEPCREGPPVRQVPTEPASAEAAADSEVDSLLAAGYRPGEVMLLTTGPRHAKQVAKQRSRGLGAYWESWSDDEVFYGHVLACKGLQRRAVVLCLNGEEPRDRLAERLYVGMSRASEILVLVGDLRQLDRTGVHLAVTS